MVESPSRDQILHGRRIVPVAQAVPQVQLVGLFEGVRVQLHPQAGALGHANPTALYFEGLSGSKMACPIWRQSVAIILVAVRRPVARRNSERTSRPE